MTYPLPGVIVDPNGQSTSITITSKTSGQTPTVYSDNAGQNVVSMPKTISAPYTFYLPNPGTWTVGGVDVTLSDDEVATVNLSTTSNGAYAGGFDVLPAIAASGATQTVTVTQAQTLLQMTLDATCAITLSGMALGYLMRFDLTENGTGGYGVTINGQSVDINTTAGVTTVVEVTQIDSSGTLIISANYTPSQGIVSIGGTGVATEGGVLTTLDNTGTARNTLDDGSGNASFAGIVIGSGGKIYLGAGNQLNFNGGSNPVAIAQGLQSGVPIVVNGTTGTITWSMPFQGGTANYKKFIAWVDNYTGSGATIDFATHAGDFTQTPLITSDGGITGMTVTTTSLTIPTVGTAVGPSLIVIEGI